MSASRQIRSGDSDLIALIADYHFEFFDPDFFIRLSINRPVSLRKAQECRQAEFLAGRLVARRALERLKVKGGEISIGQGGMPIWPPGLSGSISHTRKSVCCAVAKGNSRFIGIDCEDIVPRKQAAELSEFVLSPVELSIIRHSGLDFAEGFTLLFSAKESCFKAVYPVVRRSIDFRAIEVVQIDEVGRKVLLVHHPIGHDLQGQRLSVDYIVNSEMVITLATLEGKADRVMWARSNDEM